MRIHEDACRAYFRMSRGSIDGRLWRCSHGRCIDWDGPLPSELQSVQRLDSFVRAAGLQQTDGPFLDCRGSDVRLCFRRGSARKGIGGQA